MPHARAWGLRSARNGSALSCHMTEIRFRCLLELPSSFYSFMELQWHWVNLPAQTTLEKVAWKRQRCSIKPTIFDNRDATAADDNDDGKLWSCRVIGETGSHGWSCSTP
mmetsp:Transcript_110839/g.207780  ORF Transcript_110839/g.207780 Transcript_110839/m.207780 type:complete len:109 (+) Transcript_110839:275-601(+)